MIDAAWLVSVLALAIAMSATPGPNNMMVMASGATYGFAGTVPHIAGIAIGFPVMLALLGMGGHALLADPRVHAVLKWVGAAYLLWLAWRIASADPKPASARTSAPRGTKPMSFLGAALFQWVNPKAWILAASALVTYGAAGSLVPALVLALVMGIVAAPAASMWTMIGVGAARFLGTRTAVRRFNLAMAALLAASLVPVLLE